MVLSISHPSHRSDRKVSPTANFSGRGNFSSRWGGKVGRWGEELFPPILCFFQPRRPGTEELSGEAGRRCEKLKQYGTVTMVIAEGKYDMEINLKNIYGDMFPEGSDLSAGLCGKVFTKGHYDPDAACASTARDEGKCMLNSLW